MRLLVSFFFGLIALAPASGQEAVAPTAIAPILSRTLTPGALRRLVGERHFKDQRGGLVKVTCRLKDPGRSVALDCEAEFRTVGAMREESLTLRCSLGLDGHVRRSGFVLVRGRDRVEADGAIRRGSLELSVREARGEHTGSRSATVVWTEDALPYTLAAFVVPLLDMPHGLRVRVFHPVTMSVNAERSTLRREEGTLTLTRLPRPGPGRAHPGWRDLGGPPRRPRALHPDHEGSGARAPRSVSPLGGRAECPLGVARSLEVQTLRRSRAP